MRRITSRQIPHMLHDRSEYLPLTWFRATLRTASVISAGLKKHVYRLTVLSTNLGCARHVCGVRSGEWVCRKYACTFFRDLSALRDIDLALLLFGGMGQKPLGRKRGYRLDWHEIRHLLLLLFLLRHKHKHCTPARFSRKAEEEKPE